MSMRRSSTVKSRPFGQDDRSVGGVHMIQQQFKDMHRKIDHARKHVDNEPPSASMFKRPHFSSFGTDYRERIREKSLAHVHPRVDSSEPQSFHLIKNLYINRKTASQYASPRRPAPPAGTARGGGGAAAAAADGQPAGAFTIDGRETYASRSRPLSARVASSVPYAAGRTHTGTVLTEAAVDESTQAYAESITSRLEEIAVHREQLRRRRILRASQANATREATPAGEGFYSSDDVLREAAQHALTSMRRRAGVESEEDDEDEAPSRGGGAEHRHAHFQRDPTTADDHGVIADEPPFAQHHHHPQQFHQYHQQHAEDSYTAAHDGSSVSGHPHHEHDAVHGVLRGPDAGQHPKPASGQFKVPTPPARSIPTVPSPAHLRRTPPPADHHHHHHNHAAVNGVLQPGNAAVPTTSAAVAEAPTGETASNKYAGLQFPTTMAGPETSSSGSAGASSATSAPEPQNAAPVAAASGQAGVFSANDFVAKYDDDDDSFDRHDLF